MKNTEIADLLRELNRAKGKVKEIKTQLMVVAVEELGISQKEAQQSNVESILDGYLIGQGMMQTWRDAA